MRGGGGRREEEGRNMRKFFRCFQKLLFHGSPAVIETKKPPSGNSSAAILHANISITTANEHLPIAAGQAILGHLISRRCPHPAGACLVCSRRAGRHGSSPTAPSVRQHRGLARSATTGTGRNTAPGTVAGHPPLGQAS